MRVRRCAHLMVELDQEPRFAFETLLDGGDGLDRSVRWLAFAPHLPAAVPVSLAALAVLQGVSREEWMPADDLAARHGRAPVDALVAAGLLLRDVDDPDAADARARDAATREIAWWTPALVAQAHGAWVDVDIEARNDNGLMLSSAQMVEAFGAAPEPDFRRAPDAPPQPLAPPRRSAFDDLLEARRTCRNFDAGAVLSAGDFATMLRRVWGAFGTRELAPGAVAVKKNSPAGGGLHAVEAYVLVQRVEGVAPGLYHYLSMGHALEPLRELAPAEAAAFAHRFVAGQDWFRDAPVMVVMTARFDRLFWKYRRHTKAWRVVHLDVGHLSQTMYLSATELGLGCFVTAAINDRVVEQALALPPLREGAIALVGFGPRATTMRTMELDELVPVRMASAAD
jgi:putative peptide maturation dehydrogenase